MENLKDDGADIRILNIELGFIVVWIFTAMEI